MDQVQNFLKSKDGQDNNPLGGMLNNALGGGKQGEEKEDQLDKAVDMFQERVLKQGPQDNEVRLRRTDLFTALDEITDILVHLTGRY